jgi:transcriptional regulator with XRE-family HTH domain
VVIMAATPKEIGVRVRAAREQRGLSREVAAGLAGISTPYLGLLERGQRHFNRRGLLEDLAQALTCSVADLTGQPYAPVDKRSAMAMAAIPEIKMALYDCSLDDVPDLAPRPVAELAAAARMANEHRDNARYDLAGQGLGQLLTELHVVAVTGDGADREAALTALVEAAGLVAYGLAKSLGHTDLAVRAAERGVDAARRLDDPALIGFAGFHRALALMHVGARRRAASVLTGVIDDLSMADPTGPGLAAEAYGFAHLTRALLASRSGQGGMARDHLDEAARIASRTGDRNGLLQHFGPTNVAVWRVAVGAELQEGGKVYEQAQAARIDTTVLGSANRIACLNFDLARSLAQEAGRRAAVLRHLDLADQNAPQRVRHDPLARELLAEMKRRARRQDPLLDSLCHRFGLTSG